MVVLADEILESFFETDLSASFRLETLPELELSASNSGLLGDIWSTIATDSNKKIFNMFTDEIGKTIGKHQVGVAASPTNGKYLTSWPQVIHKPSIGRYTKLEEPKARESLLTPGMRHSSSRTSLRSSTVTSSSTGSTSTLTVDTVPPPPEKENTKIFSPMPMVQAANAALMERTAFAIDDAKDDDEDDYDLEGEDISGDNVMDEVMTHFAVVTFDYLLTFLPSGGCLLGSPRLRLDRSR